jgi:acyl-CoA synthetase (NDP forming)
VEKFFQDPKIDMLGIRLNVPETLTPGAGTLYRRIADLSNVNNKRVFVLTRATEPIAEVWHQQLTSLGLTFTGDYRKSLRAMSRLRNHERDRAIGRFTTAARTGTAPSRPQLGSGILSYHATESLLQPYAIPLAPAVMAQSANEAARAAEQVGYPCVLKVVSVDIPHKTELGALRTGLEDTGAVQKAYDEILARTRAAKPAAKIEGVLVQKQMKGVECLLGVSKDEQLGPTLVMGLGGVFVEILADVAIRIPPISAAEARRALESLKGRQVFSGVRGAPPADLDALAEMAARLSWLAHDLRDDIAELDLNPVIVLPAGQGAFAVDALTVMR